MVLISRSTVAFWVEFAVAFWVDVASGVWEVKSLVASSVSMARYTTYRTRLKEWTHIPYARLKNRGYGIESTM